MELTLLGDQALNRANRCIVALHCEQQTRAYRPSALEDGASTANAVLAPKVGTYQPKVETKDVSKEPARLDLQCVAQPVDVQCHLHR
jgi:hypothetical protein